MPNNEYSTVLVRTVSHSVHARSHTRSYLVSTDLVCMVLYYAQVSCTVPGTYAIFSLNFAHQSAATWVFPNTYAINNVFVDVVSTRKVQFPPTPRVAITLSVCNPSLMQTKL